jgi:hypothetical protein
MLFVRNWPNELLIEVFRDPLSRSEMDSCLLKLYALGANLQRETKRNETPSNWEQLPCLWILAPTASRTLRETFGFRPLEKTYSGIYQSGQAIFWLVIHQLPEIPETRWVRGRDSKQVRAIREVKELPQEDPKRGAVIRLLVSLKVTLEEKESEEVKMELTELTDIYLEWEPKTLEQGIQW